MSNLQLIEELCCIAERQMRIIRAMSLRLAELDGLSDLEREAVAGVEAAYAKTIGADECPDEAE